METLTHYDRELFYAINHGLSHPLLDPVMWLITSLGLGWVQLLLLVAVSGYLAWRRVGYSVGRVVLLPGIVAFVGSGIWRRSSNTLCRACARRTCLTLSSPPTSGFSTTRSHRGTRRRRSRWRSGCSC
jgi:hypothetical protein